MPKFNLHRRFRHREDVECAQSDILTTPLAHVGISDLSATSPSPLMTQSEQLMPLQAHVEFEECEEEEEEEETPQLSLWMAVGLLVAVAIVYHCYLVARYMC